MAQENAFDLVVIGAGPGGYVAAIRAAQLGRKVALVEKRGAFGGTCLNVGCIPSKALLESSELYFMARNGLKNHGISIGEPILDLRTVQRRKEKIVGDLSRGISFLLKKNRVATFRGWGSFLTPNQILVAQGEQKRELECASVIIASGSAPRELPQIPFDGDRIISSSEALALERVPRNLIVIGAGPIGLEIGSIWSRFGSKVTIIEQEGQILPGSDRQCAEELQRCLQSQGIAFVLCSTVKETRRIDDVVHLIYLSQGDRKEMIADQILVAVGRRPFTDRLNLEKIELNTVKGKIAVDGHYRTSARGVFAIGDSISGPMLAHKASAEGVAAAEIACGRAGNVNYEAIPSIVYTDPELAEVGMSEQQAESRGIESKIGSFSFGANGRARTLGQTKGFCKIVAEAGSDRILGASIVGPRASEMISELVLALEFRASSEDIARTSHGHPTLCEVIEEAALAVNGEAIHG